VGGEAFGGTFDRSGVDGEYYFQGGGIAYHIYRVEGLNEAVRQQGKITVSPEQIVASDRRLSRKEKEEIRLSVYTPGRLTNEPKIDGGGGDWRDVEPLQWDKDGRFPVSVRIGYDEENLYLYYEVSDDSPWVNRGLDWQTLFKSGDGVDLQLGLNENADPSRSQPVPGDLRLLIASNEGEDICVVYRHRVPGAAVSEGVTFQSPWRNEHVDVVRRIGAAQIAVNRGADRYAVEAAIPLEELGLQSLEGKSLRGDVGVIYGDAEGTINVFRNYWSNQATGLVNDVPGEIMLHPNLWGEIRFPANR
ncbi:MAG: FlgD immunoglobulin-like domain containing protein, partial [Puniceicoccales bacterium]